MINSFELFAGCGGLAYGIEKAGFQSLGLIELDHDSCETLRINRRSRKQSFIHEMNVSDYNFATVAGKINLLAAGPPCQPFSLGGKHAGQSDKRNMFPEVIRAIREIRPQIVIIENVKGLMREAFKDYLNYILLQLQFPSIRAKHNEDVIEHKARLEKASSCTIFSNAEYIVHGPNLFNLVDFGVPQYRERVFIVAIRSDLKIDWDWPTPSHSYEALLYDKWVSGKYWQKHNIRMPSIPENLVSTIAKVKASPKVNLKPWRTVRDALKGLPEPLDGVENPQFNSHIGIPGARSYKGHTGSPYDMPSKTIKAGDHGVPGGENMLLKDDGSVRYFTVRESARIQSFPDSYKFAGSRTEAMRQIGNAVPVNVSLLIAKKIYQLLSAEKQIQKSKDQVAKQLTIPNLEYAS